MSGRRLESKQIISHLIQITDLVGVNPDLVETMQQASPYDFWTLFVDDEIITYLVAQTNLYAAQKSQQQQKDFARLRQWKDVDENEMRQFLGIVMWMGMVKQPSIFDYWRRDEMFATFPKKIMSRNRFQILLSCFHYADNQQADGNNRLSKIEDLVKALLKTFRNGIFLKKMFVSMKVLCHSSVDWFSDNL